MINEILKESKINHNESEINNSESKINNNNESEINNNESKINTFVKTQEWLYNKKCAINPNN